MRIAALALPLALSLAAATAQANVIANFDAGTDGWSMVDFLNAGQYVTPDTNYAANHQASGGASGGYIDFFDPSNGSFFFSASSAFLGDLSAYAGGTLSYSQKVTVPQGFSEWRDDPDVVLVSNGQALVYQFAANPGSDWTSFSAGLTAAGWHYGNLAGGAVSDVDFQGALSNVSALYLRGEYISGVAETTGLDSVSVNVAAVPEPESYALMLAGLGIVGWAARRRQNSI